MATHQDYETFQINLFDIGDPFLCCYSSFCCCCASAHARTHLDGSSCCFNLFCLGPVVTRWLARTAYGIPGTESEDFLYGCFCPCCSTNQILQTTKSYGFPPKSGTIYNQESFSTQLVTGNCWTCCESFLCTPCTIGTIAEKGLGMPWWMGCTFLTPCSIRNLTRYHYRLQGNDLMEELCLPCSVYTTASCLAFFFFIFSPCICFAMCPSYVSFLAQLNRETEVRGSGEHHRYLVGYTLAVGDINVPASTRGSEIGTELKSPLQFQDHEKGEGGGCIAVKKPITYDDSTETLQHNLLQNEISPPLEA